MMSMAIHRISANGVPAMLTCRSTKLSRVAKVGSGSSKSGATQAPAQAFTLAACRHVQHAPSRSMRRFTYALAALSSVATHQHHGPAEFEVQAGGVQQGVSAYAQVEQQVGQALDITA